MLISFLFTRHRHSNANSRTDDWIGSESKDVRWVLINAIPVLSDDQRMTSVIVSMNDVTEQKVTATKVTDHY